MWEFRIFRPRENINFIEERGIDDQFTKLKVEHRKDVYYDHQSSKFGIKERWGYDTQPLLELKVRRKRTDWGAELWSKCIKVPINALEITKSDLRQLLVPNNLYYPSAGCSDGLNEFMDAYDSINFIPRKVMVKKARRQLHNVVNTELVVLEYVELSIATRQFESICIESESLPAVKAIVDELYLSDHEAMGYPEFICTYEVSRR